MLHRLRLPDKGPGIITHCHSERQYLSFRAAVPVIPSSCEESGAETGVALQILHSASRSFTPPPAPFRMTNGELRSG